jgi:hypothetical protein
MGEPRPVGEAGFVKLSASGGEDREHKSNCRPSFCGYQLTTAMAYN